MADLCKCGNHTSGSRDFIFVVSLQKNHGGYVEEINVCQTLLIMTSCWHLGFAVALGPPSSTVTNAVTCWVFFVIGST